MKLLLSALVLLLTSFVSHVGATCNALTASALALTENDITYPSLPEDNFTVIFPASYNSADGSVTIVDVDEDDGTGGIAGTFWHTEKRRISDGFKASFTFEYTGNSDGLAFVIQNDKIEDIEGTGGAGLGFFNGLDKYLAVGIDVCPQLSRPTRYPCDNSSDVLVSVSGQAVFPADVVTFGSAQISRSLFPRGADIAIDVYYLGDTNQIAVYQGTTELLTVDISANFTSIENHFDGRFGHFGFTSSNGFSAVDAGTFTVKSLVLDKFISEIRVDTETAEEFPKGVEIGKQTFINVVVVDSCNLPSAARKQALGITPDTLNAWLEFDDGEVQQTLFAQTISGDTTPEGFLIIFQMPNNLLGNWTFYATVTTESGIVNLQNVPIANAIITEVPAPVGLPLWGLILLISLLSILVLAMAYVIRRLYRYRQKLKEHEEDIGFGKEKRAMDALERDVTYVMNPLMGTLEEMEAKLAENTKILDRLRTGEYMVENVEATIGELKATNEKLRKEMNDLKIQEQKDAVMKNRKSGRGYRFRNRKQEFDQEKAL